MTLNWLDIVIIVIVALSVAEGVAKGFARVGIGFAAALIGLILSVWFYGSAGYYVRPYVSHEGIANFIGFCLVFVGVLIAGGLVGAVLSRLFKWAGLSWMDRLFGAFFGVFRGLVGAIALVLIMVAFTPRGAPKSVEHSYWAPDLLGAADVIVEFAPRQLKDDFFTSYEQLKKIWNEHAPDRKLQLPDSEI